MVDTTPRLSTQEQGEKSPLYRLIKRLADNKYWLGRRYAEWCTAAPTLESAVAAAAMAQDEIGHARSLYPLFRQFVGQDVEPEDISDFHSMACLDTPFSHWADFVAANFLVDSALSVLLLSATDSSYDDLRNRARRITGEEEVHWLHGRGWVRRLAAGPAQVHNALETSTDRVLPEVLMWFGRPDDQELRELPATGVLEALPDDLRGAFLSRVQPVITEAKLTLPSVPKPSSPSTLPWNTWDDERFRITT
jgi:phenylacetate-CoA oxygenase PaaI subunit